MSFDHHLRPVSDPEVDEPSLYVGEYGVRHRIPGPRGCLVVVVVRFEGVGWWVEVASVWGPKFRTPVTRGSRLRTRPPFGGHTSSFDTVVTPIERNPQGPKTYGCVDRPHRLVRDQRDVSFWGVLVPNLLDLGSGQRRPLCTHMGTSTLRTVTL